jgi:hypothetical protein
MSNAHLKLKGKGVGAGVWARTECRSECIPPPVDRASMRDPSIATNEYMGLIESTRSQQGRPATRHSALPEPPHQTTDRVQSEHAPVLVPVTNRLIEIRLQYGVHGRRSARSTTTCPRPAPGRHHRVSTGSTNSQLLGLRPQPDMGIHPSTRKNVASARPSSQQCRHCRR